jgi:hypothetical protein
MGGVSIATLIRRMTEAGAPPEAIALAVEEIEGIQASLESRRSADRDRKRAQREAQKTADVTGQSGDIPHLSQRIPKSPPALNKEKAPTPPKEIKSTPRVCVAREADRWHRMPEGWRPTKPLPPQLQAKIDQWPPGAFDDEVANLKRWAANAENKNGKGKKLDWDKALWTWIGRRHDERYSRSNIVSIQRPRATNPLFEGYRAILDEETRQSAAEGGDGAWSPLPPTGSG